MHWLFKVAAIWFLLSFVRFVATLTLYGDGDWVSPVGFIAGIWVYQYVRER